MCFAMLHNYGVVFVGYRFSLHDLHDPIESITHDAKSYMGPTFNISSFDNVASLSTQST